MILLENNDELTIIITRTIENEIMIEMLVIFLMILLLLILKLFNDFTAFLFRDNKLL